MILYLMYALPGLLLGLYAQMKVKRAFNKYRRVRTLRGMTGAQAARAILDANGLYDVAVEKVGGFLSDHYDPRSRILRLSPDVYNGISIASVGVAAHESGHAIQHAHHYWPLQLRTTIVPTVQIGSWLGPILFFLGWIINWVGVAQIGLLLFGLTVVFSIVTLPVEIDASRRAKKVLVEQGIVTTEERKGVNAVLDAAALTYVAAAVQALLIFLYYASLLSGRRR